ncbi:sensor histidine kinase [Streptacidiphilus jiangxiensis]|uniref:Two-component system, NarL family, sensor histidine kinase DesK n=1 Tax=Streptacidiphilus jiangxiensis TaxID=235985 RepID=A0A1H7KSF0_STRJI|nr:histidine kinase [Streptacidiphilus jiangxiensis]SEK89446.1 two-component system, NarL family, sensor histidine kinase DesK [Streptacidiphilus jiangxiensis]
MGTRSRLAAARSVTVLLMSLCVLYGVEPLFSSGFSRLNAAQSGVALGGMAAFFAALLLAVRHGGQAGPRWGNKPWSLVCLGVIAVGLYLQFGPALVALPALFGGTAGFALSRYRAVPVVLGTLASIYLAISHQGLPEAQVVDLMGRAVIEMSVIYAVGKIALLSREIERNRVELARLAVVEERLRFSRDLHDVLGHSLSVISIKGEVAARLTDRDPCTATEEMNAVVEIARRSAGEIRSLVRGYRGQSLDAELEGAVSVLEAAGIRSSADAVPRALPAQVQEVLSWVIREGVTNVLRHSRATRCEITMRAVGGDLVLDLVNNGIRADRQAQGRGAGSGLVGLAERLAGIDGRLSGERISEDEFRLRATAPLVRGGTHDPTGEPWGQAEKEGES